MNFHVVNLGCKVNKVESDSYVALCLGAGLVQMPLEEAHLVVVNTCAVTSEAEKKTRKTVRHVCKTAAGARVIVTGCSAALHKEEYERISSRIEVVSKALTSDYLKELVRNAAEQASFENSFEAFPAALLSVDSSPSPSPLPFYAPVGEGFRTRTGIKVQDGCNNACSYCIVHVARGHATSRPVEEVLEEVNACIAAGSRELVLTGINLGSYHQSYRGEEYDLAQLLRLLLRVTESAAVVKGTKKEKESATAWQAKNTPAVRFRLGSIEPLDVSDELISVMAASNGRICQHLHLPLQAGSSKVLKEMYRPYTAEAYLSLVQKLRKAMPALALSTDIIVGFPGETQEDFEQTCELAKACAFNKIHVFPYSLREDTPAAQRPDQIDPAVKNERAAYLRNLAQELTRSDKEARKGTTEWAIVEEGGVAMTESYYSVSVSSAHTVGSFIPYQF